MKDSEDGERQRGGDRQKQRVAQPERGDSMTLEVFTPPSALTSIKDEPCFMPEHNRC